MIVGKQKKLFVAEAFTQRFSVQRGVLKNLSKFTRKQLLWNSGFINNITKHNCIAKIRGRITY